MFNPGVGIIQQGVADMLQLAGTQAMQPYILDLCFSGQAWAYSQITSRLGARGWTLAQILAWDLGPTVELELACFRVLSRAAALLNVPDKLLVSLDWREELKTVELTTGGVYQNPLGTAGQPAGGIGSQWNLDDAVPGGDPVMRLRSGWRSGWDGCE